MNLPLVPVAPESLPSALALMGAFAILGACLAARSGKWTRLLLLIWWVAVVAALISTVFRPSYRFDGLADLASHGWQLAGALVLLYCAQLRFRSSGRELAGTDWSRRRSWRG